MKKIISLLLTGLLFTLTAAGCGAAPAEAPAYRQISMSEAKTLMENESDFLLLDVRTPQEFADGHIPGAVNLPNETIGSEKPELLPDQEQLILIYCRSGNRSKQASEKLAALGYTNIMEFGGINTWNGDIVVD